MVDAGQHDRVERGDGLAWWQRRVRMPVAPATDQRIPDSLMCPYGTTRTEGLASAQFTVVLGERDCAKVAALPLGWSSSCLLVVG